MRRGTTPTITVTVDADITDMNIFLAFRNCGRLLVKSGDELEVSVEEGVTTITTTLTQDETLAWRAGTDVEIQVRAEKLDGTVAIATDIATLAVERILQGGVLDA